MTTVRWRTRALADVARIVRYVALDNPVAAAQVARELVLAGNSLDLFPHRGRLGREAGTRELLAVPPYVIVNRLSDAGAVMILRVWHSAQSR